MALDPKVVEDLVTEELYYQFPDTLVTVCCIKTSLGVCFVGDAHVLEPAEFDVQKGKDTSRRNAVDQLFHFYGKAKAGELL